MPDPLRQPHCRALHGPGAASDKAPSEKAPSSKAPSGKARKFRKLTDAEKTRIAEHVKPLARGEQKRIGAKLRAFLSLGMSWDDALKKLPARDAQGNPTAKPKPARQGKRKATKRTPAGRSRFIDDEADAEDGGGDDPEGEETEADRAFIDDS